ncbi:MAG TPA: trigger factor [Calditrichia bacterium]|nr:trigger factor [Calditrichota bacterium]HQU71409.1 trigger factor [Calditrichia bacterium]HQV31020.1 trigger factor [Calditrichia bacterium]
MEYDVKSVSDIKREIAVSVTAEDLTTIEKNVIKKVGKQASLPGFRKGHVPVGLLRKTYGEMIRSELLEEAISTYYRQVLTEVDFNPISEGEITKVEFENIDQGLRFDITLEVEPTVELKKYKGLKVEKEIPEVTPKMIEETLENVRSNFATTKGADEVKKGLLVTFNAQKLGEDNVPLVGQKYDDVKVEIGAGHFDEDLEMQLVGLKLDQEKVVSKTTEEDGKSVTESYEVVITGIEERELPELDDELVKKLNEEGLETVAQLKERIETNMQSSLERRTTEVFNKRLVDELLKENPFEVPEAMVVNYTNYVLDDMKRRAGKNARHLDEEDIRRRYRPDAIHAIRWHLLKRELITTEDIKITDEEIHQKIDGMPYSDEEKDAMKKGAYFMDRFREDLQEEKVLTFLADNAKIKEIPMKQESDPA